MFLTFFLFFPFFFPFLLSHRYTTHVRALRASGVRSTRIMRENYILAVEDLHTRISPMIMRRTKKEVLTELPSKTIMNVKCDKSKRQRAMLENLQRNHGSGGGGGTSERVSSQSKKNKEKMKETSVRNFSLLWTILFYRFD